MTNRERQGAVRDASGQFRTEIPTAPSQITSRPLKISRGILSGFEVRDEDAATVVEQYGITQSVRVSN